MTYTLIAGIDLLEAVQRYARVPRDGAVKDAAALPFELHGQSERPSGGPILFLELELGAYWLTVGGEQGPNRHYCAVPDRA